MTGEYDGDGNDPQDKINIFGQVHQKIFLKNYSVLEKQNIIHIKHIVI